MQNFLSIIKAAFTGIPADIWRKHIILYVLTFISVTMAGYAHAPVRQGLAGLFYALSYGIPIMLILTAHELGHYIQARRYGVPVSLPYFIPMPFISPFGTMGAFIRLQGYPTDRRSLFDVAFWGPAMSFLLSIPCIIIGIAITEVGPATGEIYGDPMIIKMIARIFHNIPPGYDVAMNPLLFAGWAGLFVTAINLFPIGQLDGGHIAYSVLGKRQKEVGYVFLFLLGMLAFQFPGWFVWILILVFMGIEHPPLDQIYGYSKPLDKGRFKLAFASLLIFVISFTPVPIQHVQSIQESVPGPGNIPHDDRRGPLAPDDEPEPYKKDDFTI